MGYSRTCKLGSLTGLGICLSVFGSCFVSFWPEIFDKILNNELALSNNSKSYELWEVTPIPMYIEFYFFNWTNVKDLKKKDSKPILEEIGPFVFREHRRKVIHGWHPENDTVTFRQNRTWVFEPSLSNGTLDEPIMTINIPAITAAFSCRNLDGFTKMMLDQAMRLLGTRIYVKKKVREFLFEGYTDPLLDLAAIIPPSLAPVAIPFDKFGWFYTRNGSADYDGIFNMRTGVDDITKLGVLAEWDYTNKTSFYESNCGRVNGSAGEFFPPKRDKGKISLFSPDICRTLDLNYKEEVKVDGINGYRYWGDDKMFANETQCPDNWCFCPAGKCPPHGALDVSTCKWGAPAYISFPHFYHADESYRNAVIGMHPEEEKHQMYIDLEPRSGIPLQVAASFQINILLQPLDGFSYVANYGKYEYRFLHLNHRLFKDVPKTYFPAIWFKQTARIDDEIGPELKLLTALPDIGIMSSLVLLSIGLTILIVVGIFYVTIRCRNEDESFHGLGPWAFLKRNFCARFSCRVRPSVISSGSQLTHDPRQSTAKRNDDKILSTNIATGLINKSPVLPASLLLKRAPSPSSFFHHPPKYEELSPLFPNSDSIA